VRAFRSVGGAPRFFTRGEGARVWDADGKAYLDYVGSWGPLILGHADPDRGAPCRAAALGGSFGAPTEGEIELAELLVQRVPSMDMVRLVSSGTEATMSAIRLARGFTGRDAIVKFEGCYHGHGDSLLVKAGSGLLTFGNPSSAGVPADLAQHTLVLDYNDAQGLRRTPSPARQDDRLRHRRAGGRQHEPDRAQTRVPRRDARAVHAARRGADLRRGDDRLSASVRVRRRGSTASRPTCRPSARWSAAACRWAPSAAGATSWKRSRRWARCTRPARCRAIRCRWRRAW
jgi:hypothetical protein